MSVNALELRRQWLIADARQGDVDAQKEMAQMILPDMGGLGRLLLRGASEKIGLFQFGAFEIEKAETFSQGATVLTGREHALHANFNLQCVFSTEDSKNIFPPIWRVRYDEHPYPSATVYFWANDKSLRGNLVEMFPSKRKVQDEMYDEVIEYLEGMGRKNPEIRDRIVDLIDPPILKPFGAFLKKLSGCTLG